MTSSVICQNGIFERCHAQKTLKKLHIFEVMSVTVPIRAKRTQNSGFPHRN